MWHFFQVKQDQCFGLIIAGSGVSVRETGHDILFQYYFPCLWLKTKVIAIQWKIMKCNLQVSDTEKLHTVCPGRWELELMFCLCSLLFFSRVFVWRSNRKARWWWQAFNPQGKLLFNITQHRMYIFTVKH